jgi:hypothetical protein
MLRRNWLALLVVLGSCAPTGPNLTYCTTDAGNRPEDHRAHCSDANRGDTRVLSRIDNWACLSPRDRKSLLEACKLNRQKNAGINPRLTYCVIDCADPARHCEMQCSDGDWSVTWPITSNYSCLSPQDTRTLLRYCKISSSLFDEP